MPFSSPTQWPPLTSRIDISLPRSHGFKRHTYVLDFAFYKLFYFFYISVVVTKDLILLFEVKILFEIGNIYRDFIVVYLF